MYPKLVHQEMALGYAIQELKSICLVFLFIMAYKILLIYHGIIAKFKKIPCWKSPKFWWDVSPRLCSFMRFSGANLCSKKFLVCERWIPIWLQMCASSTQLILSLIIHNSGSNLSAMWQGAHCLSPDFSYLYHNLFLHGHRHQTFWATSLNPDF